MTAPLISATDLQEALRGPRPPVLLDVRWRLGGPDGATEYAQGHLPGAVFVDLERDLAAPAGPGTGRHPLPTPAVLQRALRRAGISAGSTIVVYDDWNSLSAARAWWLLRWAGLPDVRVLDGGLAAWTSSGGPLTTSSSSTDAASFPEAVPGSLPGATPGATPGDFVVRPGSLPVLTADEAAKLARSGILLDARAGERYRGEVEPIDPVAGHIPGAVSAPTTDNLAPDGRLLPPDALRARFAALGLDASRPIGAYCGSGVTAAHELLALAVAGIDAVLYPGSWSEWVSDPARPVATGSDPG
jgi:thiosulfate/3-mercaptopyruvate sulfurtransferase